MKRTQRLFLARPVKEDFGRFYEINADPETNLFNPAGAMTFETAENVFTEMTAHWDLKGFGSWSIREIEKPDFIIGFGGLSDRYYGTEPKLNLGYRFDKKYWGKGYATELAQNAIGFGLNEIHKREIFAIVRPNHLASIKVLEKCNMLLIDKLDDVPGKAHSLIYKIEKRSDMNPI